MMRKAEEIRDPSSCLNRAEEDEPVFVLLGRDECAAEVIAYWAALRVQRGKNKPLDDQVTEALRVADSMLFWRSVIVTCEAEIKWARAHADQPACKDLLYDVALYCAFPEHAALGLAINAAREVRLLMQAEPVSP